MKKILIILFLGLLFNVNSYAEEISLVCKSNKLMHKGVPASYLINTKSNRAIWQNGDAFIYFMDGSNLKHISGRWQRHTLNRDTGVLKIELYEFKDEKKEKEMKEIINDTIVLAGKEGDKPFLFRTIFEILGKYKSNYEVIFNCERSKKLF